MAPNPNGIRIIQVDDGCSVMYFRPHPITAADIDQIVSRYPPTCADVIAFELAFADTCQYQGQINEARHEWPPELSDEMRSNPRVAEGQLPPRNIASLIEQGLLLPSVLADTVHRYGFAFWPGMRSNAAKFTTAFKDAHEDWLLPATSLGRPGLLDYERPEVRSHVLAQMRELVETCDADGFYFNLMRAYRTFHPDRALDCADLMTAWIGEIRRMLDEVGAAKGKRLPLAVQVLSRVQDCVHEGHDVRAWAKDGFVDYLCPARDNHIDYNLPMEQWLGVVESTACRFFPVVQPGLGYSYDWTTPDQFRALFYNYHRGGAHGLSTMNLLYRPEVFHVFDQFRQPDRLEQGGRHYHFSAPPISSADGDLNFPLQTYLHPVSFEFILREQPSALRSATVHFTLDNVHDDDQFIYRLNGRPIPPHVEYDGVASHPYRVRRGSSLVTLKQIHTYRYTLSPGTSGNPPLKPGLNHLSLAATRRSPQAPGLPILRSIEVII